MRQRQKNFCINLKRLEDFSKRFLKNFFDIDVDKAKFSEIISEYKKQITSNEDLRYFRYPPNSVLLFGSEKGGVPDVLLERADAVVSIPQFGIHNDMNLSVAVGIVLYDWVSKNVKLA